jgi:transposase-like protein DUF772
MSIRPRLGAEVPALTAQVARASNPAGTTAMWVRDRSAAYGTTRTSPGDIPETGARGSRRRNGDGERAAVPARPVRPRCRRGGTVPNRLKYALGLDLDDPGFHHSVLSDFRDRLLEDGRADRLLDLALAG